MPNKQLLGHCNSSYLLIYHYFLNFITKKENSQLSPYFLKPTHICQRRQTPSLSLSLSLSIYIYIYIYIYIWLKYPYPRGLARQATITRVCLN